MHCEKNGCKEYGERFGLTSAGTDALLCVKHRREYDLIDDGRHLEYMDAAADVLAAQSAVRRDASAVQALKDVDRKLYAIHKKNRETFLAWLAA